MFPTTTQERRRSWNLTTNESWRPRSASTGVIEISPFSRNLGNSQRTPATPCFVSPRMAFSTQFNYDSPIQVLTSSSPCVFKPMSVRNLKKRCSLRRLPPRCKILLIVLCLSLAGSLYFIRSLKEPSDGTLPCTEENCSEATHEHPSLQRFLGTVNEQPDYHPLTQDQQPGYQLLTQDQQPDYHPMMQDQHPQYHSLTQDLDNPNVELPNAPSLNHDSQYFETTSYQGYSTGGTPSEAAHKVDDHPRNANTQNRHVKVSGVYIEESNPQENPVNTSTHLGSSTLLVHEQNGLEVKSITKLEDLPLLQHAPASMHDRERRDLNAEDQGVKQDENAGFHTIPGQVENTYIDQQNSRREILNDNTLKRNDETLKPYEYTKNGRDESQNAPPQGGNIYFYPPNGKQMGNPISGPPRRLDESSNFHPQFIQSQPEVRQPQLSEREIEARLTRHSVPKENLVEGYPRSFDRAYQEGRPMQMGYMHGEEPNLRNENFMYDGPQMERFPPGVNPRRYRNEF